MGVGEIGLLRRVSCCFHLVGVFDGQNQLVQVVFPRAHHSLFGLKDTELQLKSH